MVELIITEKPTTSLKIAEAIADKKPVQKKIGKVSYYELEHNKNKILITCAVGHLYNLAELDKKGWRYPVFSYNWKTAYEVNKDAAFTKPYLDVIKKLARNSDSFVIACDDDQEGEVIGYNILRFLCKKEDANRMHYSTTTKEDLLNSYENKVKHLDKNLVESGLTRHEIDWIYGINLSRALTLSIKHATGLHQILSSGRVQGPALKILYDKEKEIGEFKPVPFRQIFLDGLYNKEKIEAWHKEDKFWDKKKADISYKNCKDKKEGIVDSVSKKEFVQNALFPFDLTSLQTEAYKQLGLSPKRTLEIAQNLYVNSYISYPRTSSQKLPVAIGYSKILKKLERLFPGECKFLLNKKNLKPSEGNKTDPAHPAIYPTGEYPKKLSGKDFDLYELIARRFFACFGEDAVRENMNVEINVNKEIFIAKGVVTKKKGWHELYGRFAKFKDEELPNVKEGDKINVKKIEFLNKETQPPNRYSEASIIKELEKRNLGTKSTRAAIIDNLHQRNYIREKSIEMTVLGNKTVETLLKYAPEILDENLTRELEDDMEKIQEGKETRDKVLDIAKKGLLKGLDHFKKHEKEIGKELSEATVTIRLEIGTLGKCPNCKSGKLMLRRGKFGNFAACDKYPECKTTFSLPNGYVKVTDKICAECKYPIVLVIKKGKRPLELCINPNCKTKEVEKKKLKELEEKYSKEKCPKCGGDLIIRKGIYGVFVACGNFPKCSYTESLKNSK